MTLTRKRDRRDPTPEEMAAMRVKYKAALEEWQEYLK